MTPRFPGPADKNVLSADTPQSAIDPQEGSDPMTKRNTPADRLNNLPSRSATAANPRNLPQETTRSVTTTTTLNMPRHEATKVSQWLLDLRDQTGVAFTKTDLLRALIDLALTDPDVRAKAEQRTIDRRG